ncbi:DUF6545 domain-containing protein [Micromonospora andamanensis]|uniref:DUF6545 domain-containing protein n=1 Tax=Micromonospora andamanensis TaxID=1287068 RepID=A0ABQ4HRV6_9ACTN|nr:DUF6545 domain-containing protein [Micromonospora andamanensis]GIJ08379.1 hypothetical protein Van01_15930 [Micromonospora andamanensis]
MIFARARLSRRLRQANVPQPTTPYNVDAWCEEIGQARGRRLRVHDLSLGPDLPTGLLVRRPDEDTVIVDAGLPALTRTQTVLHEVAHLILDHDGDALHDDVDQAIEAEAEMVADLLYQRLTRAAESTARVADRGAATPENPTRVRSAWFADRRADWHLLNLWITLQDGTSGAAIISTSTTRPVPVEIRGRRQRHRTVIEIHEALRILRPWYSSQVHDSATRRARRHRLDPEPVAAIAEAATIAVALRHRRASLPPGSGGTCLPTMQHSSCDVPSEARRLARLSHALHDSPLVTAEIARWVPVVNAPNAAGAEYAHQHERIDIL